MLAECAMLPHFGSKYAHEPQPEQGMHSHNLETGLVRKMLLLSGNAPAEVHLTGPLPLG